MWNNKNNYYRCMCVSERETDKQTERYRYCIFQPANRFFPAHSCCIFQPALWCCAHCSKNINFPVFLLEKCKKRKKKGKKWGKKTCFWDTFFRFKHLFLFSLFLTHFDMKAIQTSKKPSQQAVQHLLAGQNIQQTETEKN